MARPDESSSPRVWLTLVNTNLGDVARVTHVGTILGLKPEDERRIHPQALKWFHDQKAEVTRQVPLDGLTDDDLNTYLDEFEKRDFQSQMNRIARALAGCMDIREESPPDKVRSGLAVLQFEVGSLGVFFRIGLLLKKVHQRKVEALREEQKKLEEEERRKAGEEKRRIALRALAPPFGYAEQYLSPDEQKAFGKSIHGAIDAYLAGGESYSVDSRAKEYVFWLDLMGKRKGEEEAKMKRIQEQEQRKAAAQSRAREYNQSLNREIARLKSVLHVNSLDIGSYLKRHAKDARYRGYSFAYLLPPDERRKYDTIVKKGVDEMIPGELARFLLREYTTHYWLKFDSAQS